MVEALAQAILADRSDLVDRDLGLPPCANDRNAAAPARMARGRRKRLRSRSSGLKNSTPTASP
jgi:hypothetical protein